MLLVNNCAAVVFPYCRPRRPLVVSVPFRGRSVSFVAVTLFSFGDFFFALLLLLFSSSSSIDLLISFPPPFCRSSLFSYASLFLFVHRAAQLFRRAPTFNDDRREPIR